MNAEQRQRASQLVKSWSEEEAVGEAFALQQELIAEQPASVPDWPDWLEITRFLTDVTVAAGLLAYGRRDKGLARRIGDFVYKYRMLEARRNGSEIAMNQPLETLK